MLNQLLSVYKKEQIRIDEPMKNHTTFKVGGKADFFVLPENEEQIVKTLDIAKQNGVSVIVLGNGSNVLVSDKGIRGIVICTLNMKNIEVDANTITAYCGASMASLAAAAKESKLSGLEFASGIPGTVGGGIYMNAGAYGGSLSDCAQRTLCITKDGEFKTFVGDEQEFDYRKSVFSKQGLIVIKTVFALNSGDSNEISSLMNELNARRRDKQPLDKPSAGSTFKRPEGYFAGKLIEDACLKGFRIGGASVSEKHAGFIINDENGTAEDVINVMKHCKNVVFEKFGVNLEPEVRLIGDFE